MNLHQLYKKQVEAWKERFCKERICKACLLKDCDYSTTGCPWYQDEVFLNTDGGNISTKEQLLLSRHKDTIELIGAEIKRKRGMKKELTRIGDCDNCGDPAYGKCWYGKGKPNDPYGYGDAYYPTGDALFCKECFQEHGEIGKEWDGEKIWKRTSDLPEHEQMRINSITVKVKNAEGYNQAIDEDTAYLEEQLKLIKNGQ